MKLLLKTSLLFIVLIFIFSCSEDNSGLEITIHSPEDNTSFNMGDTIVLSYTVKDDITITTIAWDTKGEFGTGSLQGTELLGTVTEYSGEFLIPATASAGTYEIYLNATDQDIENALQESVTIIIK